MLLNISLYFSPRTEVVQITQIFLISFQGLVINFQFLIFFPYVSCHSHAITGNGKGWKEPMEGIACSKDHLVQPPGRKGL